MLPDICQRVTTIPVKTAFTALYIIKYRSSCQGSLHPKAISTENTALTSFITTIRTAVKYPLQGGDIVIASGAIRQEGTTCEYAPIEFPAVPSFDVLSAQVESARKFCLPYHVGVVQSKDSFFGQHAPETMPIYPELQNKWDAYCKLDCLASEMESSTVFIVSQTRHVRSGAMFLCLANQEREKAGLSNIQNHDLKPLMECAVSTLKNLIEKDEAENH